MSADTLASTHAGATTDIAIVGGGMVGASLALLLAQALPSSRISLIERQSVEPVSTEALSKPYHPSFDARSTALSESSVDIYRRAGVWSSLSAFTTAIETVHVSDRGHLMGDRLSAADYGVEAVGYVVDNSGLGQILSQQLHNCKTIDVIAPADVTAIAPLRQGHRLTLQSSVPDVAHTLTASLVIVADGADSALRRQLGIGIQEQQYGQSALIANVAFSQPHNGVAYERFTDTGPLALLPRGLSRTANTSALVWTLPSDQVEAITALSDAEFLQCLQDRFGYRVGEFTRVGTRYSYPLRLLLAEEQVRRGLVVMGNAAHFLHPVAGQGFNLALRDCAMLAQCLGRAGQSALGELSALQEYERQQACDQQLTVAFSDGLTRLFSSTALPAIGVRHSGLLGLEFIPLAKQWLAQQAMGTGFKQARW